MRETAVNISPRGFAAWRQARGKPEGTNLSGSTASVLSLAAVETLNPQPIAARIGRTTQD